MDDKIRTLQVLLERPMRISAFIAATNHLDFEQVQATASEMLVVIAAPVAGPEAVVMLTPAGRKLAEREGDAS